jgi:coproporphyrinogen III oxidase
MVDVEPFLRQLREQIIGSFEQLEGGSFQRQSWNYHQGSGGGEMALLRGQHFEKAAVHFSAIRGEKYPLDDGVGPFYATGISLITHMANPHAPTVWRWL